MLLLICLLICPVLILYLNYRFQNHERFKLLDKFPGPPGLPIFGNAFSLVNTNVDFLEKIDQFIKSYKFPMKIQIFGGTIILTARPEDASVILSHPGCLNRSLTLVNFLKPLIKDSIIILEKNIWRPHRKLLAPIFLGKMVETFFDEFRRQSQILVTCLQKETDTGVDFDLESYITTAAFDGICATLMGVSINSQTDDTNLVYLKAIKRLLKMFSIYSGNFWQRFDLIYKLSGYKKEKDQCIDTIYTICQRIISKRIQTYENQKNISKSKLDDIKNENQKVFLDYLFELAERNTYLKNYHWETEVNAFIVAGHETTAVATLFTLLMLAIYPDIQQKVYDEIINVMGPTTRPIEISDIHQMTYLDMVLKESLRKYPPVPYVGRYIDEQIQIKNYVIPKGTSLLLCLRYLHYDPNIWTDPEKFDPERFLPDEIQKRPPNSFIPFSAGVRNCIGQKYAMLFMKAMIISILREYHLTTDWTERNIVLEYSISLKSVTGYRVKLHKRNIERKIV